MLTFFLPHLRPLSPPPFSPPPSLPSLLSFAPSSFVCYAVAPTIMTPRFIASAASTSSSSSSRPSSSQALGRGLPSSSISKLASFPSFPRRSTSTSLQILENIPALLSTYIPESPGPSSSSSFQQQGGSTPQVSLLRGFQATVPSSEKGKERRRKVRGGVATKELGVGGKGLGLKKLGMESRGLLGELTTEEATEEEGGMAMTGKERRRRKREKALSSGGAGGGSKKEAGIGGLGREELLKMEEEIGWDRENIVVRKVSLRALSDVFGWKGGERALSSSSPDSTTESRFFALPPFFAESTEIGDRRSTEQDRCSRCDTVGIGGWDS